MLVLENENHGSSSHAGAAWLAGLTLEQSRLTSANYEGNARQCDLIM